MLAVLVQWHPVGMTEGQLRPLAKMAKSGTYGTYKSILLTNRFIESRGDLLYATASGVAAIGKGRIPVPRTTAEVLALWEPRLKAGARRMLRVLVGHRGRPISRDTLAREAGMNTSGTFGTYLSLLKTAGLVETAGPGGGQIAAHKKALLLE